MYQVQLTKLIYSEVSISELMHSKSARNVVRAFDFLKLYYFHTVMMLCKTIIINKLAVDAKGQPKL